MNKKSQKIKLNFRRFEFKYVIPSKLADIFIGSISSFVIPDPYIKQKNFYNVSSIYLDSPQLLCFYEKQNGLKNRKKYRLRFYDENPTPQSVSFLEIKKRVDSVIIKDRIPINAKLLEKINLTSWKKITQNHPAFFHEFYKDYHLLQLRPKIFIKYKRKPFFSKNNPHFRITFDYDIKAAKINKINGNKNYFKNILHETTVMEVKFNGVLPNWFGNLIKNNNLQRGSFSKYCKSIKKVYNLNES